VGSAAIELVRKIFGDLQKKSILVVGAGKMGEAALRHLSETGSKNVYLTSRRPETALELARRFHGMAVPFADLRAWAARADVVFTSTGSTEILIDPAMVQGIMHLRKNAPIAFIDISVPRNVDPRIGSMENVFFYDIDDLQAVVEANLGERVKAAAAAEKIVDQEVEAFCVKLRSFDVAPVVAQVQNRIDEICRGELERSLRRLGPPDPRQLEELQSMIARIAHKIAHPLIAQLRNARDSADQEAYHELIRKIFKLQKDGD
jgi:glutamyl-tRNA reductase